MNTFQIDRAIICSLLVFCIFNLHAQSRSFRPERTKVTVLNLGINGLFGGIGSLINKKEGDKNLKTFATGFYKGAVGGVISHAGLSMSHLVQTQENIAYAWPARFVNAMGSSIVQNAAENRRMFERLHFNLYVARLEYLPYQKQFRARLFTSSLYGLARVGAGNRFDLGKSLKSGILYFESEGRFRFAGGTGIGTGQVSSIGMRSDLKGEQFYRIYAEEVAHIQQYDRKVAANAFVSKSSLNWKENSKVYNTLSTYVYLDLNGPTFFFAYLIASRRGYCNNLFEKEAVNYANRRVGPCN